MASAASSASERRSIQELLEGGLPQVRTESGIKAFNDLLYERLLGADSCGVPPLPEDPVITKKRNAVRSLVEKAAGKGWLEDERKQHYLKLIAAATTPPTLEGLQGEIQVAIKLGQARQRALDYLAELASEGTIGAEEKEARAALIDKAEGEDANGVSASLPNHKM